MPALTAKFRYLIVDDYGNVNGSNDELIARQAFFEGDTTVIDCHTGESFEEPDETTTGDIRFVAIPAALDAPPADDEGLDE